MGSVAETQRKSNLVPQLENKFLEYGRRPYLISTGDRKSLIADKRSVVAPRSERLRNVSYAGYDITYETKGPHD